MIRIGFGIEAEGGSLYFDIIVDVFFFIDIIACFRTAFFNSSGELVVGIPEIRSQYLKGWFGLDFMATFPFDHVGSLIALGDASLLRSTKLLRILRLARLLR